MGVPQLTSCCFCCSTETGSKVIAWLHTVVSIIMVIFSILALVGLSIAGSQTEKDADAEAIYTIGIITVVLFVIYLLTSILGICLLVGIYNKKLGLIKLFIVISTVLLCLNVVFILIYCVLLFTGQGQFPEFIKAIISLGFSSYFLLVIYSYYRELKYGKNTV